MSRLGMQVDAPLSHTEMAHVVREAHKRGLETVFYHEGGDYDSLSFLTAVALQTEGIKLGTAVSNVWTRAPIQLAMGAATLDRISEGRAVLGISTSHRWMIEDLFKIPMVRPMNRVRDYVHIINGLTKGETVTYTGKAVSVENIKLRLPGQHRRVPIYLGTVGLQMARLAGEVADGVILHLPSLEHVGRVTKAIAEGAEAAGRDPADITVGCFIMCLASRDLEYARMEMINAIAFYGRLERYRNHIAEMGFPDAAQGFLEAWGREDADAAARCVSEEMLGTLAVAIGYDDTRRKVEMFREAGANLPIVYPFPVDPWANPEGPMDGYIQSMIDAMDAATGH